MDRHPRAQLSAYLDDALSAVERSAVAAHLDTCADCRARLAELRVTVSLIRALPDPVPSRRLVPRLATVPVWLAPLRTLTTLASGVSVFLFIASALLANTAQLATMPTSFQAPAAGGAPAASASSAERNSAAAPTAAPGAALDATKTIGSPSPSPEGFQAFGPAARASQDVASRADSAAGQSENAATPVAPQLGPSPLVWLALALVLALVAIALQRRLRSA